MLIALYLVAVAAAGIVMLITARLQRSWMGWRSMRSAATTSG